MWEDKNITLSYMSKIFNVHTRTLKRYANRNNLPRKA